MSRDQKPNDLAAPVTLSGEHVRLVPLESHHLPGLLAAERDGDLHRLWFTTVPSPAAMEGEIAARLALQANGSLLPFTVTLPDGQIVGMTNFLHIDAKNRRVEIGATWYAASWQRRAVNTEAKLLLLRHAFGTLGCIAVEFRTHILNARSRRAIERLGARLDGILRAHQIASNGTVRDTCVYSITAPEWPAVEAHLLFLLQRGATSSRP